MPTRAAVCCAAAQGGYGQQRPLRCLWRDALAAVAIGTVLLGDKQEADKYKQYNEGHVADNRHHPSRRVPVGHGLAWGDKSPLVRASGSTRPTPAAKPWAT